MKSLNSKITIDNSAIDKIFLEPKSVLGDIDLFWKNERACQLALEWAPKTYPIHLKEFEEKVRELSKLPLEKRKKESIYQFARKIIDNKKVMMEKALPIIFSYLPPNTHFETTVYLSSFLYLTDLKTFEPKYEPNAFVREPNIVVNLSSKFWTHDANQLLNLMTHEIYHIAFETQLGKYRPNLEIKTNQQLIKNIAWLLLYEGLATYVGYKALAIFPAPISEDQKSAGSYDYKMIDDLEDVRTAFDDINELIKKVPTLSYDVADELIRQKAVMDRSVYIAGAYMALIIERKKNLEILIESLKKGPIGFIKTFNEIDCEFQINLDI